jgi:excisionase family DNA binding protein
MPGTRDPRPDDLMTSGEAARVLGLSADMVRWLEREGRLPAQRTTNGFRLFRRCDVERLSAERARGTAKGEPQVGSSGAQARSPRSGSKRNR